MGEILKEKKKKAVYNNMFLGSITFVIYGDGLGVMKCLPFPRRLSAD